MTNLINPESGKTNWAIFSQADKLSTSKGERKLRADLAMLLGGKEAKHMDQTHHLAVALEGNKIREHKADKPLVAGFGQVAVKIKNGEGPVGKDEYIVLNINSLAKRLGLSKKEIKENEKEGTVHKLIKDRLNDLVEEQQSISRILSNIKSGISGDGEEFKFDDLDDKEGFVEFVEKNFDDKALHKAAKEFVNLEFKSENKEAAEKFINLLEPKIWWNSEEMPTSHDKLALTQENLGNEVEVFYGKAFQLTDGNAAKEARYLSFVPEDQDRRFAVRVSDYIYSTKPTSHSKDEMPMKISDGKWVLVNVKDLERFGCTREKLRDMVPFNSENLFQTLVPIGKYILKSSKNFVEQVESAKDAPSFSAALDILNNEFNPEVKEIAQIFQKDFNEYCEKINQNDQKNALIEERVLLDAHRIKQKLASIGALPGVPGGGHIEGTFRGGAAAGKGLSGHYANRMAFDGLEWDTKGRYAPKLREETYLTKPTNLKSNEVALKKISKDGKEEWYVFNRNSLGRRLGLQTDLSQMENFSLIEERISTINHFNMGFEDDFGDPGLTSGQYKSRLNAAIRQHPDEGVKEVLQMAADHFSKLEKRWVEVAKSEPGLGPDVSFEAIALKKKLIEIGALSENREVKGGERKGLFAGILLTEDHDIQSHFNNRLANDKIPYAASFSEAEKISGHAGKKWLVFFWSQMMILNAIRLLLKEEFIQTNHLLVPRKRLLWL